MIDHIKAKNAYGMSLAGMAANLHTSPRRQ
jgi:hypothetical protein